MDGSLGNLRALWRNQQRFAMFQTGEHGLPSVFDGALEMDGLHTDERKRSPAREKTRSARAGREMQVLFQKATQPGFLVGVQIGNRDEFAVEHFVGLGAQNVG